MAKQETIQWLTPWFVARFPKISKPDTEGKFADGKFKTDGVFEDAATLKEAEKILTAAGKKFWPDADEVYIPVKDFFANKDDKKAKKKQARGISLKSKRRPAVFDCSKPRKKLPESLVIGAGSVIRVDARIAPWTKTEKVKTKDASGKVTVEEVEMFGVTLYMNDVQVKKHVAPSGGGTGEAFSDDEEGFSYEGDESEGGEAFGDATDL